LSGCLNIFTSNENRPLPESPTGTWLQSAHDAGNTGASNVTVPERGTPAWNGGSAETIPPLVDEETVYSVGDALVALDGQTGEQQWRTNLEVDSSGAPLTQPAVTGEHILLGSTGRLMSFDPADGSKQWTRTIDGVPIGPMTVAPDLSIGVVPFERPQQDDPVLELVAFSVASGETEWTAPLRASIRTTPPAVFDECVYASGYTEDETPILRSFAAEDGALMWERTLDAPTTPPVATTDGVFIGDDGAVLVYDPKTGEHRTSVAVADRTIRAIAVADVTVFVLGADGLAAVSASDGSERWSTDGDPQADGLAVGQNTVVAPISGDAFDLETSWPCIGAFDRIDGTTRWYYAVDDTFDPTISAPPVIADGAVFAMSNTNSGITALGDLPPNEE